MKASKKIKAIGIIPARYGSTRFPGKPLALIAGKPMIQHVYENSLKAELLEKVIVATDDERIAACVREFNGEYVMTDSGIETGTERVAVAAKEHDADIILNIQGDEPLIQGELLDELVQSLVENENIPVCTPVTKIENEQELKDPNLVRVVLDKKKRALYFSRAAIPYNRDVKDVSLWNTRHTYWKHIGIYCFRKDFLFEFVNLPVSSLEKVERLEQLRILENGYPMLAVITDYNPVSVDIPEDIAEAERVLQ